MTQDHSEDRNTGNARYRSYLLRLWQEGPGKGERVLLQDVLGGEPRCFSSLEGLFAYLEAARGHVEGGEDGGLEPSGSGPRRRTDRGGKEAAYEPKNGSCHLGAPGGHDPDHGGHIEQ